MDFVLFTLVNVVIGLVLYVLFSMRMQAAQDKMKAAHPLQKDVEANIREGLQSMNAHLDEMHEVRANFYQLLRHAEDVTRRLEDASRKAARKRTGRAEKEEPAQSAPPVKESDLPRDSHIERLIENLGVDEFRPSESASSPPERSKPAPSGPGVIDTLGAWAMRMFGMKEPTPAPVPAPKPSIRAESKPRPSDSAMDVPELTRVSQPEPARPTLVQLPSAQSAASPGPAVNQDPNAWIRALLASGTEASEISRITGRTLAEIELIASLPQPSDSRRRSRLSE